MPRTNEKDAYYFPHDCNARNDPKVLALRSVFGAEGYGVYFMTVEILREQPEYKLKSNKYLYNALAMQMQVQVERVQEIIEACCTEFTDGDGSALFVNDGEYLYSASLLRRMGKVDDISKLRKEAARKRWENKACKDSDENDGCKTDANAEQSDTNKSRPKQSRPKQTKADQKNILADFAAGDAELLAALEGFVEIRKKSRRPLTERAQQLIVNKLVELSHGDRAMQVAIVNRSIENGWTGIFPLPADYAVGGRAATGGGKRAADKPGIDDTMGILADICHDEGGGAP